MIRLANIADIPRIVEMGNRLNSETSYNRLNYSPDRVEKTCEQLMAQGFAYVYEKEGEVVGCMLGDVYVPWYTDELVGIDYSLYIEPEHRGSMAAALLIRRFTKWCEGMGAKQIRPGTNTGEKGAIALYERLGYKIVGVQFLREVEHD